MFDRPGLKLAARARLKGNWVQPMLVLLLYGLISGIIGNLPTIFAGGSMMRMVSSMTYYPDMIDDPAYLLPYFASMFSPVGSILSILLSVFVLIPIAVAVNGYFIRFWRGETPTFGSAFDGFSNGRFVPFFGASLWQSLWLILWALPAMLAYGIGIGLIGVSVATGSQGFTIAGALLLLVALGLLFLPMVKEYSYLQTTYLVADHPSLGAVTPLNLSKRIMEGHKWEAFVLGLSFLPWILLIMVTCGLASLYVGPYMNTTMAAYYEYVVDQALQKGVISASELGVQPSPSYQNNDQSPSSGSDGTSDPTIDF